MAEKNWIGGGGRKVEFDNGGHLFNISLKKSDLDKLPVDKYGCVKVTMSERRSKDKAGNDYMLYENTYVSGEKKEEAPKNDEYNDNADLPF